MSYRVGEGKSCKGRGKLGKGSPARGEGSYLILSLIAEKKFEARDLEPDWDAVLLGGGFIT